MQMGFHVYCIFILPSRLRICFIFYDHPLPSRRQGLHSCTTSANRIKYEPDKNNNNERANNLWKEEEEEVGSEDDTCAYKLHNNNINISWDTTLTVTSAVAPPSPPFIRSGAVVVTGDLVSL